MLILLCSFMFCGRIIPTAVQAGPDKLQICADLKSGQKMYLFENVEQKCTFLLTNRGFQNGKTLENRIFRELVINFSKTNYFFE